MVEATESADKIRKNTKTLKDRRAHVQVRPQAAGSGGVCLRGRV
jgi:hypothetical protein